MQNDWFIAVKIKSFQTDSDIDKKCNYCNESLLHVEYTRSSDSAPSISAILRLVLIEKLPKSSFSALLELNTNSFSSD